MTGQRRPLPDIDGPLIPQRDSLTPSVLLCSVSGCASKQSVVTYRWWTSPKSSQCLQPFTRIVRRRHRRRLTPSRPSALCLRAVPLSSCAPIISQLSSLKAQPHPDGAVSSPSSDAFAAQERKESALQPQREGVSATTAEPSPGKKQKRPTASRRSKAFTADDGKRAKAAPNQKLRKRRDGAENSQVGDEGNGGSAPPAKRPRKAQAPSTAQVEDGPSPSDSSSNAELATQPPVPASPTDGAAVQAATQSPSLTPFYTAPNHALRISNLPPQTTASILRDVFSKSVAILTLSHCPHRILIILLF